MPDTSIYSIWEKFKTRFRFEKFDLVIENKVVAASGIKTPQFVKYISGTNKPITDPKLLRFSTGEIKSYNLINAILNIESEIEKGSKFTLVLDDPVDSFDYKNKYAFIDYLVDVANNPNVQTIVLTHNFDFFRSLNNAISPARFYLSYRNAQDEISIKLINKEQIYFNLGYFNSWKQDNSLNHYLALIPFARNVIQLSGYKNDVKVIDKYMHYDRDMEIKTFFDLNTIMAKDIQATLKPIYINSIYLAELINEVNKINVATVETDLGSKLVLALYIRIALERFLYLTVIKNTNALPSTTNDYKKTRELINQANKYLSDTDNSEVLKASIICPAFVHANSFMYEPLVDVSAHELVNTAKWLINKNNSLDYNTITSVLPK